MIDSSEGSFNASFSFTSNHSIWFDWRSCPLHNTPSFVDQCRNGIDVWKIPFDSTTIELSVNTA